MPSVALGTADALDIVCRLDRNDTLYEVVLRVLVSC